MKNNQQMKRTEKNPFGAGRPKEDEETSRVYVPVSMIPTVKNMISHYKIARKNGETSVTIREVTISAEVDTKGMSKKEIINEVYLKSK